jgi:hypothetical protein
MKQRYRNEAGSTESKTVQLDNKVFDAGANWEVYLMNNDILADVFRDATPQYEEFIGKRKSPKRTVEQARQRIESNQLPWYILPEEVYKENVKGKASNLVASGGYHGGDKIVLRGTGRGVSSSPIKEVVKTEGGDYPVYGENVGDPQNVERIGETLVHELGHEFYGHRARRGDEAQWVEESEGGRRKYTPPERTLYQKADRFLKGWLPNLGQKYAQRPNLLLQAQGTERSKREIRYNKRMQEGDYHPQYSDLPFYDLEQSVTLDPITLAKIGKAVAGPDKAKEFRTAFREARKRGDAVFTWDDRKYTTELKK